MYDNNNAFIRSRFTSSSIFAPQPSDLTDSDVDCAVAVVMSVNQVKFIESPSVFKNSGAQFERLAAQNPDKYCKLKIVEHWTATEIQNKGEIPSFKVNFEELHGWLRGAMDYAPFFLYYMLEEIDVLIGAQRAEPVEERTFHNKFR